MNLSSAIARGNMSLPASLTQPSIGELFDASEYFVDVVVTLMGR